MKHIKPFAISVFYIIIGAVLICCGIAEIADSFWSGMGGALIAVGAIQLIRNIKFRTDEEYREKMETEAKDERNKFIAGRAWAWSGYAFVIIDAIGTIGFKIAGNDVLSQYCAYSVCLIMILYWISWLLLRKKY